MTKLHYFLILVFYSVLFSCQDKDKFVLEENKADIEQIITAVIEQDSINILKNNKENNAVVGHFRKNDIIKDIDKNEEPTLFSTNLDYLMSNGFDEKDSLYLLSQNEISDTIKLPESILKNSNILKSKRHENNLNFIEGNIYHFNFPIISKDKTKAYIEMSIFCGRLCGGGMVYLLQKQNGKWVIVNKRTTWIS